MTLDTPRIDSDEKVSLLYLITSALRDEASMPEQDACRMAEAILTGLAKRRGGEFIYCPSSARRAARDSRSRDESIRERLRSGEDASAVAALFGLSTRRVYQIGAQ